MARRFRRPERGASAVEFALVMPFLLLIVFALIQYGLYFWSAQTGSNTVNNATRQLSVGNCQDPDALQTYVDSRVGGATADATVDPVFRDAGGNAAAVDDAMGGTVTLTITFPTIDLNFPFVPFMDNPVVTREVTARVEDTTDQGCGA